MGIEPDKYRKYSNFKQLIILTAQRELKAESDISFEFVEIKKGRAVDKIEFHVSRNAPKEPVQQLTIDTLLKEQNSLSEFGLKPKAMSDIIDAYSNEQIERNIAYTKNKVRLGEVKNPAVYVKRTIENDYAWPVTKTWRDIGLEKASN